MGTQTNLPEFCDGLTLFGEETEEFRKFTVKPAVTAGPPDKRAQQSEAFVYQTLLGADAMRHLTLLMTAEKSSGHPGGFASSADAVSSLVMLGFKNIITEVGHHAPGYYANLFLDTSLESMNIRTVKELKARFRERKGLPGHVTGAVPGILAPAGPLGQGQHFAMAAAYLHPATLFPVILGDGGLGEPYVLSSLHHFRTLFPAVTNILPMLIWNGFSQEHHSIVSEMSNGEMIDYWRSHGFSKVHLVDAKEFGRTEETASFADTTAMEISDRLRFTRRLLEDIAEAARAALSGESAVVILKQLKGAGVHRRGAQSHNLNPGDTFESPDIEAAIRKTALPPSGWSLVRENFRRAGGGPASVIVVTESQLPLPELGTLPVRQFGTEERVSPTTAFGELVAAVGKRDLRFIVANADGNQASGMMNINKALGIRHPVEDTLYEQRPDGRVYEPLSEDACAGLTAAITLLGGRALWCSYESFAINGLPIWQTVVQALAEMRRKTPSAIALFTAGALEQGRNGWTHQRPEIEAYFAALMRNGNVFPLFPIDANMIQSAYQWALDKPNAGIPIFASKSTLPIRSSLETATEAIERGAMVLLEPTTLPDITIAVIGDMILVPVFEAVRALEAKDIPVRVVSIVNPRRLCKPDSVHSGTAAFGDSRFLNDEEFGQLFGGGPILGITGGASGMLEPLILRAGNRFDLLCWKRGDTAATSAELYSMNGLSADSIVERAVRLMNRPGDSSLPHSRRIDAS